MREIMNTNLMTDTDVKAACLAQVFKSRNVKGFGASEAKTANDVLVKLFQAGRMDAETFGRVAAYLGNHSAIRQWAIAHGFINSEPDALTNALEAMIEKVSKAEGKALDEIVQRQEHGKKLTVFYAMQTDNKPVTTIHEFRAKYGTIGWKLIIEEFVLRAPDFQGDLQLADTIGVICTDLETALRNLSEVQ